MPAKENWTTEYEKKLLELADEQTVFSMEVLAEGWNMSVHTLRKRLSAFCKQKDLQIKGIYSKRTILYWNTTNITLEDLKDENVKQGAEQVEGEDTTYAASSRRSPEHRRFCYCKCNGYDIWLVVSAATDEGARTKLDQLTNNSVTDVYKILNQEQYNERGKDLRYYYGTGAVPLGAGKSSTSKRSRND